MIEYFKSITINQYKATLQMIESCVDECPENQWLGNVANHSFSESVFHSLFFADLNLCRNLEEFKTQEFHLRHAAEFEGYEELEDRPPEKCYTKTFVKKYLEHCRQKVESVVSTESETDWVSESEIPWQEISRGESHTHNIRHLQHHAAQLILRLRLDTKVDIAWVRTG